MPSLRVISGPLAGTSYEVVDALVLGREGADIVIDDAELSRRHLTVRRLPDGLEVEDLGSTNGTFVDGLRLSGTIRVGNGRQIRAGTTVLEVAGLVAAPAQQTLANQLVDEAQVTRQRAVAEPAVTAQRAVPPVPSEQTAPRQPAAAPRELLSVPAFAPPAPRKGGGLASRSWVPVALSFGTVVAAAVALVLYFYFQNN